MNTLTETSPQEQLKERLTNLKKNYLKDVRLAKLSCKFNEAPIEQKAKMIKAGGDKDTVRRLGILFCSTKRAERKELFALLTDKAVVRGFVSAGMSLSMSFTLSKEHYSIVLTHPTLKDVTYRFPDESFKMTNEQADKYAKGYFPKITKIEWR